MDLERSANELRERLAALEHIVKSGGEYELVSHSGKDLGKYSSRAGAEKRERQVEYFKHAKEAEDEEDHYSKLGKLVERVLAESGSDEIRGKNKAGQIRAMWHKDPDNPYADD